MSTDKQSTASEATAFRAMRRARQQLSEQACIEILQKNTAGVLAVLGDGGWPYAVPLSYVYADGCLYFHCAKTGHKLDALRGCDKASFCVIDRDQVVPEEYTTYFRSVIAFGRAEILTQPQEIRAAIERLAAKYNPTDSAANRARFIDKELAALCMVRLRIEHLTGKQAKELVTPQG